MMGSSGPLQSTKKKLVNQDYNLEKHWAESWVVLSQY